MAFCVFDFFKSIYVNPLVTAKQHHKTKFQILFKNGYLENNTICLDRKWSLVRQTKKTLFAPKFYEVTLP